jgi:hypothetical protein
MTAECFFKGFVSEWDAANASGEIHDGEPFEDKTAWTSYMLKPGGFLNRVMDRLKTPDCPLYYRNEWYTVDALYVGGENLFQKDFIYPSSVKVLIEHEHSDNLEEEMWKLIHWRAPLKAIIAYDWSEQEKTTDTRQMWADNKVEKLLSMLRVVNQSFAENPATEYLFLIAQRQEPKGPIVWRPVLNSTYIFSGMTGTTTT